MCSESSGYNQSLTLLEKTKLGKPKAYSNFMPKKRNSTQDSTKKIDNSKAKLSRTKTTMVPNKSKPYPSVVPSQMLGIQGSTNSDTSAMKNKKTKNVSATIQKFLHKTASVAFNKTFICCKESYIESPTSFYGCFYLGPFPESLSLTLSHNLRRTLLSEMAGLAITAVEIDGVLHQYSNIPGIKETVLDILSNLQTIVFVKTRLANSFVAFLKVRGPGVVKASDIRLPAGVALVDPDQHIATLAEDGVFNMKIWIHEGKNAIKQKPQNPVEQDSSVAWETNNSFTATTSLEEDTSLSGEYTQEGPNTSLQSNKLYLDSVFMPVTKVNSFVETNFKATDDPAKTAPFVFFETKEHNQRGHEEANMLSKLDQNNGHPKTSRSAALGNKTSRLNYFDFLSETSETDSQNHYLVLKSNMSEVAGPHNFEKDSLTSLDSSSVIPQTSHIGLTSKSTKEALSPTKNVFAADPQTSVIGKQSLLDSHPSLGQNPILISPVTYNKPAKQCHIVLEIWTNGSIHPRQALKECLAFLAKTFIGLNNVKILGSMYKSHKTYQNLRTTQEVLK